MAKPGALIPYNGVNVTLTTTANTNVPSCQSVNMNVTTAGTLLVVHSGDMDRSVSPNVPAAPCTIYVGEGAQDLPGDFAQMWLGTAVVDDPVCFRNA